MGSSKKFKPIVTKLCAVTKLGDFTVLNGKDTAVGVFLAGEWKRHCGRYSSTFLFQFSCTQTNPTLF
jgi:hypothetical protein